MDIAVFAKDRKKLCKECGIEFVTKYNFQKYCSTACGISASKKSGAKKRMVQEIKNKDTFKKKYGNPRGKIEMVCKSCGKSYYTYASHVKFRGSSYCSLSCRKKMKPSKTHTIRSLDALWSKLVKLRVGNKCEYCGKDSYLNSHHIFSRSNYSTRWDMDNGICLCAGHHMLSNFSAHKSPLEFAEWIKDTRGVEWYDRLKSKAKTIRKPDYELIKKLLKEESEKLII